MITLTPCPAAATPLRPGTARAATAPAGACPGHSRPDGPDEFYQMLAGLAGGARRLRNCRAGECPRAGVYFFFEDGEVRASRARWCGSARMR